MRLLDRLYAFFPFRQIHLTQKKLMRYCNLYTNPKDSRNGWGMKVGEWHNMLWKFSMVKICVLWFKALKKSFKWKILKMHFFDMKKIDSSFIKKLIFFVKNLFLAHSIEFNYCWKVKVQRQKITLSSQSFICGPNQSFSEFKLLN